MGEFKLGFGRTLHLKSPVETATPKPTFLKQKARNLELFCKPIVYDKEY